MARTVKIELRVSPEEKVRIVLRAEETGVSVSELVREALLAEEPPEPQSSPSAFVCPVHSDEKVYGSPQAKCWCNRKVMLRV